MFWHLSGSVVISGFRIPDKSSAGGSPGQFRVGVLVPAVYHLVGWEWTLGTWIEFIMTNSWIPKWLMPQWSAIPRPINDIIHAFCERINQSRTLRLIGLSNTLIVMSSPGSLRLCLLIPRKKGLTEEEFHRHWANIHGPLVTDWCVYDLSKTSR